MKAKNKKEAFELAERLFHNLEYDPESSEKAGYEILRQEGNWYNYVCSMSDRLELNFSDGKSMNIWYDDTAAQAATEARAVALLSDGYQHMGMNLLMMKVFDAFRVLEDRLPEHYSVLDAQYRYLRAYVDGIADGIIAREKKLYGFGD